MTVLHRQQGFGYIMAMIALVVMAILAQTASTMSSYQVRRDKEKELLFRGQAYRDAIGSYVRAGDGRYPRRLEDLLQDPRSAGRHHLRALYPEPMTGGEWVLLRNNSGGVVGVASPSTAEPYQKTRFPKEIAGFEEAKDYRDWEFVYGKAPLTGTTSGP